MHATMQTRSRILARIALRCAFWKRSKLGENGRDGEARASTYVAELWLLFGCRFAAGCRARSVATASFNSSFSRTADATRSTKSIKMALITVRMRFALGSAFSTAVGDLGISAESFFAFMAVI
jgi:hypothetical protein